VRSLGAALAALALASAPGEAQGPGPGVVAPPPAPAEPPVPLAPLVVEAPPPIAASSEFLIPAKDFELRPQGRPADILRLVPGLILGQHAGGGKAEQYFIRGFDADHGTDIALFVDNVPVNLRSHAHGQGYADLHFLIPETVQRIEVLKGPYYAEYGDFATAAAINFVTLDVAPENFVSAAGGNFSTQRYLAVVSPTRERLKTLVAGEMYFTDGPLDHAQHYERYNLFAKGTTTVAQDMVVSLSASYLYSRWHASGQIPLRAVHEGLIDRFGEIDGSEGGDTQRLVLNGVFRWRPSPTEAVTVQAYGQYYTLDLFSNFTFFLDDPVNGDGIEQKDRRWVAGLDARYERGDRPLGVPLTSTAGLQYRIDTPRVLLASQVDRRRLSITQDVDIWEQSFSPFVKFDANPFPWLRIVTGARGDIFRYDTHDRLNGAGGPLSGGETRAIPSAKFNAVLGPWLRTEFFGNVGSGFHSNDARAVITDPRLDALAQAFGWEFGLRSRLIPRVELSATVWWLDLASELVFVGDEGTTEPKGPSNRIGGEFATRVQLADWLSFTGDVTVTRASFDNGDTVPLAPRLTARADLTARLPFGLATSLQMRHLGDRYLTEDRSVEGKGYTLVDAFARYRYRNFEAFVGVENIFDVDYREVQFFFASRLPGEPPEGVEDIHFTPGTPRSVLGGIAIRF
jgi:outer membrane receptor protein involved in Fe transport